MKFFSDLSYVLNELARAFPLSIATVLAAKSSDGTKVELVTPPADAVIGERVMVEGTEGPVWPAGKIKKLKSFESVAPDLASDANCVACYQGKPLKVEAGICTVPSIASSPIA